VSTTQQLDYNRSVLSVHTVTPDNILITGRTLNFISNCIITAVTSPFL